MFRIYLKNTFRNLRKQRTTSLINIFGLAIGMAASVFIFLWVRNEMNFDGEQPHASRIFRLKTFVTLNKNDTWIWETSPLLLGEEIKSQVPEVEVVARVRPFVYAPVYFKIKEEFFAEKKVGYVDEQWFNLFDYKVVQGSIAAFNKNPFSLIFTESAARKYFGKSEALGKTLEIDSNIYMVQAVVKDPPVQSSFQFDVLIPEASHLSNPKARENAESWGNFNYLTFIRLKEGASQQKVQGAVNKILIAKKKDDKIRTSLLPLKEMHFENDLQHSTILHADRKVVYIFSLLGVLLLLIACINYVNLTTAKASLRIREVSIKKIVGASRKNLLLQFIFESVALCFIALLFSILIMSLSLPFFNSLTEKEFKLTFTTPALWTILPGTLLVSVILTSIYPAILLSSFNPVSVFRGLNVLNLRDAALRKVLVVLQFTFSIALIIGVIVVYSQLNFIYREHKGYNQSQIISVSVPFSVLRNYDSENRKGIMQGFKQSIQKQSSIEQVAAMNQNSFIDMRGFSSGGADWEGRDKEFNPAIAYFDVDEDFNKIINLKFVAGHWFNPGSEGRGKFILNETAVREFGISKPVIGKSFIGQGDTGVIIGVISDFHFRSLHEKISPMVIRNSGDNYRTTVFAKLQAGQLQKTLQAMEYAWNEFFPGLPFTYSFVDDEFEKLYRTDMRTAKLIWIFAGIAIFISCLGLFGLAAFTAEKRTKEVGIRKVLGASVTAIISLLSKDFILLVLLAFLIATPIAWWGMNKWLQDFAYHINISWWMFIIAGITALLVALLTVSFQAARTAMANPVKSLRSE